VQAAYPAAADAQSGTIVAVLPFENIAADPEREYFANGLTAEAIVVLGQIAPAELRVIGRTSMLAYKRASKTRTGPPVVPDGSTRRGPSHPSPRA